MDLEDAGERALLKMARDLCAEGDPVSTGVGDDAAVVELDGKSLVVTTDMLVEGVHFPSETSPEMIGKKATVINLSDIAAMGAKPLGLVYSIGSPGSTDVGFVSRLLRAMNSAAREYGTYLVGGDLNESEQVIVSGTAFGVVEEGKALLRSGARTGDFVGVTGELGAASAAMKAKLDGNLEEDSPLQEALLKPVARVEEGMILSETEGVNAAIDITDGLAANLWQISRMSEVELEVDYDRLPVSEAAEKFAEEAGEDSDDFVLYAGEDFELLFTARPESWSELTEKFEEIGTKITKIGEVEGGEGVFMEVAGEVRELPDRGYEHFREK